MSGRRAWVGLPRASDNWETDLAMRDGTNSLFWRVSVAGRVVLAAFGGYGLASLATALLSLTLPLARSEAVSAATLLSFALMLAVAIYVFAARTLLRATVTVAAIAVLLGAGLWLTLPGGAA